MLTQFNISTNHSNILHICISLLWLCQTSEREVICFLPDNFSENSGSLVLKRVAYDCMLHCTKLPYKTKQWVMCIKNKAKTSRYLLIISNYKSIKISQTDNNLHVKYTVQIYHWTAKTIGDMRINRTECALPSIYR